MNNTGPFFGSLAVFGVGIAWLVSALSTLGDCGGGCGAEVAAFAIFISFGSIVAAIATFGILHLVFNRLSRAGKLTKRNFIFESIAWASLASLYFAKLMFLDLKASYTGLSEVGLVLAPIIAAALGAVICWRIERLPHNQPMERTP